MKQITIRQIPVAVVRALEAVAKETGDSLNRAAIKVLKKGLGLTGGRRKKRDLSRLAGAWTKEQAEEFARTQREFGSIDRELWK